MGDDIRFELLGPLRVHTGSGAESISSGRARVMLAMLLLQPGRTVPMEQLAEAVWSGAGPRSARNQIQTCVSQLRRKFATQLEIITEPDGYRLQVDAQQVDAHRFRAMVTEARAAAANGRPGEARQRYRTALGLWRGSALAGLDGELMRGLAGPLEAERELATEECLETELALGGGGELVGELSELVRQSPYRERLHAALMRALYQAGRTADALAAFRAARQLFHDELGTEPSEELQRLHQAILKRAPDLANPSPMPAAGAVRDLPAEASYFAGRTEEITRVRDALASADRQTRRRPPVVVVYGPGGTGKSALAVRVAHQLAEEFPDGQLYVDLCGSTPGLHPPSPAEVLGRFLRRLGMHPSQVPSGETEAAALFRTVTTGRRLLLVLDNVAGKEQVAELVPAAPGCGVLLTCRRPLSSLDSDDRLRLGPLPDTDGRALLAGLTGRRRPAELEAAGEVVALCGGLPLAIRIAAGRLAARPDLATAEYAKRLADSSRRLDELQLDDLAVRASIRTSYNALLADGGTGCLAARAFRLLGLLHVPDLAPPALAAMLSEPNLETTRAALDRLVDVQLVEPVPGDRYRLHDLVRLVATELATDEDPLPDRDQAVHRAIAHYTSALWHAQKELQPTRAVLFGDPPTGEGTAMHVFSEPAMAAKWIDAELTSLSAALEQAISTAGGSVGKLALWLSDALWKCLDERCDWQSAWRVSRLVVDAARQCNDQELVAQGLMLHGRSEACLGNYDTAVSYLELSLKELRELRNWTGTAVVLNGLAIIHSRQHGPKAALLCYQEALDLANDHRLTSLAATILTNMIVTYVELDQLDLAVESGERAAATGASEKDMTMHARAIHNLSMALCLQGDQANALQRADQALAMNAEIGNRTRNCEGLIIRSEVNLRRGRPDDASADAEYALTLAESRGYRYASALAHHQRSKILTAMGQMAEADRAGCLAAEAFAKLDRVIHDPLIERLVGAPDTDRSTALESGTGGRR